MPMQQMCRVVRVTRPNPYAYDMILEAGEMARAARAGQFVHIKCGEGLLFAALSLFVMLGGKAERSCSALFRGAGRGDRMAGPASGRGYLDVMGPLGNGFSHQGKNIILVGGGIGVPPCWVCQSVCRRGRLRPCRAGCPGQGSYAADGGIPDMVRICDCCH